MAGRIYFAGIYMTKGVPNLERGFDRPKLGTPFSFLRCFPFCGRVLRTAPLDRLSLDAICVPGSAISFALPLALVAGSDLLTSTSGKLPLPSRDHRFCGGRDFCCPRFYPAAVLFFRPVRLWPDFQPEDFFQALEWYQKQDVTLGG